MPVFFAEGFQLKFRQAAEFCTIISANSPHLVYGPAIREHHLTEFWSVARCFMNRWQRQLSINIQNSETPFHLANSESELLSGEMSLRLWMTILLAADTTQRKTKTAEPIVRNIAQSLEQLRNYYLNALNQFKEIDFEGVDSFNLARKGMETWVDFLCGHFVNEFGIEDFIFDRAKSESFDLEHLYFALSQASPEDHLPTTSDMAISRFACLLPHDPQLGSLAAVQQNMLQSFPDAAFSRHGEFRPIRLPEPKRSRLISAIRSKKQTWVV